MTVVWRQSWLVAVVYCLTLPGCADADGTAPVLDYAGRLALQAPTTLQKLVEREAPTVAALSGLPWRAPPFGVALDAAAVRGHLAGLHLQGARVPEPPVEGPERRAELDALTCGLLGFYDAGHPQAVHLRDDLPAALRPQVVRHELMHALQHQHADVPALEVQAEAGGQDATLALRALLEGQASAVQDGWQAATASRLPDPVRDGGGLFCGQEPHAVARLARAAASPVEAAARLVRRLASGAAVGPEGASAPGAADVDAVLRAFPYEVGRSFVEALARRSSLADAVRRTLARPPRTTRQLLFPEAYLADEAPEVLPTGALEAAWARPGLRRDTLGAYLTASGLHDDEAWHVAEGWRGDTLLLDPEAYVGAWLSAWRDAAAAQAFVAALDASMAAAPASDPDLQRLGEIGAPASIQPVAVHRFGRAVLVLQGPTALARALVSAAAVDLDPFVTQGVLP